jgi:PPM family protein phosphatase
VEALAVSETPAAAVVVAAAATRAAPGRAHNQDSHRCDADATVFLVADGMGGHAAGEVASAIAAARVNEAWTADATRRRIAAYAARPEPAEREAMFRAVRDGVVGAHLAIGEEAQRDDGKHGMGTTLTGLVVAGGDAVFAHTGDSRAYLVRDGVAVQLSEDHNIQTRLKAAGMEPTSGQSWRGVLTSALGVGDPRVATFAVTMAAGDRFVLCTDGVHEHLAGEAELARVAGGADGPSAAAAALIDLPATRGGADDTTALVVDVVRAAGGPMWPPQTASERARESAALARCTLLEALTGPERLRALRIATPRALAAGDALASAAAGDRVAYVLVDGEAALPGGERIGPGSLLNAAALIEGTAPAAAARAMSAARVLLIRRGDFLSLTEEEPDLGVKLYAALARLMAR